MIRKVALLVVLIAGLGLSGCTRRDPPPPGPAHHPVKRVWTVKCRRHRCPFARQIAGRRAAEDVAAMHSRRTGHLCNIF